jgi:hypothetical protein
MSQLKPFIILAIMLFAFGQAAQSQSTARQPYEGAMHTYTCNGISAGADYQFYITAYSSGGGYYDDGLTGEFDIINAKGKVGGDGLASTQIQWNSGASSHIYYVWLEVSENGGCSNLINIQISPQINKFDMLSENIPVDNTMSCPAVASTDGFNPLAPAYDAGTTMLKFIVRRVNGTDNKLTAQKGDTFDWSFQPVLSVDPAFSQGISIVSIVGVNSGKLVADASQLYTVNGTDNEVTVTVAVKNVPGISQDVKLMIKNQIENQSNLPDSNSANDTVKHRIEVMPLIEGLNGV